MENTYTPLKQYLPQGQDFSMSNLSNLAVSKGISGYKGTDEQNKQLYSSLSQPSSSPSVVSNYGMNTKVNDITNKSIQLGVVTPNQVAQNQQINNPQPQPQNQQIDYSTAPYQTDANGTKLYYNPSTGQYDQYESKGGVVNYGGINVPSETLSDPYLKSIIDNQITAQKQNKTALDAQLESIKNRFIQYRDTQNQLNQSGQAGVQNALLQTGAGGRGSVAQYAAATADARVNVMVQDGIKKLQELDNQEQELVSAARQAYESNNYKILGAINSAIEQKRQEQVAASAELNKKLAQEKANADAAKKQAVIDNDIASIYSQGITDPTKIMSQLQAQGKTYSLGQVNDVLKNLVPSGLDDLIKTMRQNGAPTEIIKKVLSSSDINAAYDAAGAYSAGGTGIIGEYNFYKAQAQAAGQNPMSFNEYQTADANRKAVQTTPTGLSSTQNASFLRITDKFQADQLINAAIKGQTAVTIADQVLANPDNAANQLKSLYVLVKNLDPDSAVREGEISLAEKTQSYLQTWQSALTRIGSGQVIAPDTAKLLANATKELAQSWFDTAQKRQKQYQAQATGAGIGDAFNSYLKSSDLPYQTSSKLIKGEADAEKAVTNYLQQNPNKKTEYYNNIQQIEKVLGRPATYMDLIEAFPEDFPNFQPDKGVVGGVDITSYATDPKHEEKITSIYQNAPSDKLGIDNYIKKITPKSPITADMIINASSTYGVDPKLVLAIIQNDSSFGTKGKATYTNNPGNVGNDDEGNIKKYPSWNDGVLAVAKWLSNHKIA